MIQIKIAETEKDIARCLDIRHAVFVVEQNVPEELERDEYDAGGATHFLATIDGRATGTGRVRTVGEGECRKAKVQRVAVLPSARGTGLGVALMHAMRHHIEETSMATVITLGAQTHATGFYERLGYRPHGEVFDDAGIPHIEMRLDVAKLDDAEDRV